MIGQNGNTYEDTFYIIPRYIRKIPGITLAYLDIYEAMFQYWNKGLEVFMGEKGFLEKTGYGRTVYYDALKFFEDCGEIKRVWIKGKRYIQRVLKLEPNDSSKTEQDSAIADPDVRTCGRCTSTFADHNKKKLKKEKNISESGDSPLVSPEGLVQVYMEELPLLAHPRDPKKLNKELVKTLNALIKRWSIDISDKGNALTYDIFRVIIKKLKEIDYWMFRPEKDVGMIVFCRINNMQQAVEKIFAHEKRERR